MSSAYEKPQVQGMFSSNSSLTTCASSSGDFADSSLLSYDDADDRLTRSRDRNREHARRTRLRKKAQLQALQKRVKELQDESRKLKQTVEECSIASILLGLSSGGDSGKLHNCADIPDLESLPTSNGAEKTFFTMNGKRKRFVSDAGDYSPPPMKLKIKGAVTLVGGGNGKTHINWKTGVYLDENGVQKQLSSEELEALRRERNRMHAKMTRDRKKIFINNVEKTISDLEKENKCMREILARQVNLHSTNVTPQVSPMLSSTNPSDLPSTSTSMGSLDLSSVTYNTPSFSFQDFQHSSA
mmetsp:Transcript_14746/g.21063  ORF Transcript_14746/g.21063 Transcript_14746/m.21063 type:complete len:299 (+) Transcript_14746:45-941(+)